jgi:predicted CopG family antitoxin
MYICIKGRLMKRLHILLDDELFEKLKKAAAERKESLADVIRACLREQVDHDLARAGLPIFSHEEIEKILRIMDAPDS